MIAEPVGAQHRRGDRPRRRACSQRAIPTRSSSILPADQHVADEAGARAPCSSRALAAAERATRSRRSASRRRAPRPASATSRSRRAAPRRSVTRGDCGSSRSPTARPPSTTSRAAATCGTRAFLLRARERLLARARRAPAGDRRAPCARSRASPATRATLYPTLPSISIDHGGDGEAPSASSPCPATVGWDDVGSWAALPALRGADASGQHDRRRRASCIDGTRQHRDHRRRHADRDGRRRATSSSSRAATRSWSSGKIARAGRPQGRRRAFRARPRAVPMTRESAQSFASTTSAASPSAISTTRPCARIGHAIGSAGRGPAATVVVGRDPRVHSPRLFARADRRHARRTPT